MKKEHPSPNDPDQRRRRDLFVVTTATLRKSPPGLSPAFSGESRGRLRGDLWASTKGIENHTSRVSHNMKTAK